MTPSGRFSPLLHLLLAAIKKVLTCTLHLERIGQDFSLQCPASRLQGCSYHTNTDVSIAHRVDRTQETGARLKSRQTSRRALETTAAPARRASPACSAVLMNPVPQTGVSVIERMIGITWGIATAGAIAIAYGAGDTSDWSPVSSPVESRAWIRWMVRKRNRLAS